MALKKDATSLIILSCLFSRNWFTSPVLSPNQFPQVGSIGLKIKPAFPVFLRALADSTNVPLLHRDRASPWNYYLIATAISSHPIFVHVISVSPYSQSQTAAKKGTTITLIIILVVALVVIIAAVALGVACIVKR